MLLNVTFLYKWNTQIYKLKSKYSVLFKIFYVSLSIINVLYIKLLEIDQMDSPKRPILACIEHNHCKKKNWKEIWNKFGLFGMQSKQKHLHRFVRFLYIIRYPHSRHRIASFGRISFSWWHSKRWETKKTMFQVLVICFQ